MPKFLCITAHDPDGPDHGAVLRVRHLFRLLGRLGDVRVVLVGYFRPVDRLPEPPRREFEIVGKVKCCITGKRSLADRLCRQFDSRYLNIEGVQAPPAERERLLELMSKHDMVWVHNLKIANAVGIWHWPNSVLDVDDLSSQFSRTYILASSGLVERLRNLNQFLLWRRQEQRIMERFNAICVCSDPDRLKLPSPAKTFLLPNGFVPPDQEPVRRPVMPPRIGFVGTFKYPPNQEGVRWFLDQVWPRLLGHFPSARLRLVGEASDEQNWKRPNVDTLGFLPDLGPEMAGWSLAVVPIFAGAGTRIKIADAFSRKCPVVSTPLGAHGYDVRDGRELFIGGNPAEFLSRCVRILERPAVGDVLADNAWRKFREKWTWNAHAERLSEIVGTVLNAAGQPNLNPPALLAAA
jgi:polysaccharide biosynthesis protein PslH